MFRKGKFKNHLFIIICLVVISLKISAQEVVFLHTDKSDYISGQAIRFKAYVMNADMQKLTDMSKVIYFQLTGYDKVELSGLRAYIENGACKGQIKLPTSLKTGYYFLSAYTNQMRNYPLNACFSKKVLITNQNDRNIKSIIDYAITDDSSQQNQISELRSVNFSNSSNCNITFDKKVYNLGDKIELKIKIDSLENRPELTNLSVSVAEISPFEDATANGDIINYLNEAKARWDLIKSDNNNKLSNFITENKALILSGNVLNKKTNSGLKNVTVLLSTPDNVSNLQYYRTAGDGAFYFQLNKYYDNRKIYLQLKDRNSVNGGFYFKIDDKVIHPETMSKSLLNMSIPQRMYIENSQKIALINKIYEAKKLYEPDEKIDSTKPLFSFYGIPDNIVIPAEYETMDNFNEMTKNYMTGIKFNNSAERCRIKMVDYEIKEFQENNAFCMINSIPIFNYSLIESLNPISIKKIETKNRHLLYGDLNLYGVASFVLTEKLASSIFSELQIQNYENKVMAYENIFDYLPQANSKSNKIPDFRQILYWNPEIISDNSKEIKIELTASQYCAKYSVVIQGIGPGHVPVFARSILEIK
jgi:hypothetical protein